jgi:hypothetical protein
MSNHALPFMLSNAGIRIHAFPFLHFQAPIAWLTTRATACSHPSIWVNNFDFDF